MRRFAILKRPGRRSWWLLFCACVLNVLSTVPAHADIALGSFTGHLNGGFTNLVSGPTGFRVEFVTEPWSGNPSRPSLYQYTTLPGLFEWAGLTLPSSAAQTFAANSSTDANFSLMAAVLTSNSIASDSQLFYCSEATSPLLTCPYDQWGHWGAIAAPGTQFEFPNATINSIQLVISPFSWQQDGYGDWWMSQPDGAFATVTVTAYGEPGFGQPPPPPATTPEPGFYECLTVCFVGLAAVRRRWNGRLGVRPSS